MHVHTHLYINIYTHICIYVYVYIYRARDAEAQDLVAIEPLRCIGRARHVVAPPEQLVSMFLCLVLL